jgi:hypothetical protein
MALPGQGWAQENPANADDAESRRLLGIWAGGGSEFELQSSSSEYEGVVSYSNLLFWHVDAGLAWRLRDWEVFLLTSYGRSGEVDVVRHEMVRAGVGARIRFRLGIIEPSISALTGMVVAIDVPREGLGLETHRQYAPFVGIEVPVSLILGDVSLALVPCLTGQGFSDPPPQARYARNLAFWRAGVSLRLGYYVPF